MHLFVDILRNAVLITGLVVVMMMMIESLNIESRGMVFKGLKKTKFGQVIVAALLGSIPGCMGGFATVSLYTHRLFSFGALVAMMIASSGDEAFVMLAMVPQEALVLFVVLFVIAVVVGVVTDFVHERAHRRHCDKHDHSECGDEPDCVEGYVVHECGCDSHGSEGGHEHGGKRHYGWKRMVMFVGLAVFIAALGTGHLGHDHGAHGHSSHAEHSVASGHGKHTELSTASGHREQECRGNVSHDHSSPQGHAEHSAASGHGKQEIRGNVSLSPEATECHEGHMHSEEGHCHSEHDEGSFTIDLLSEDWMNVLFAGLSVIVLFVLLFASDHFVEEHLWNHIVRKHLPTIFAWTFGVLLVLGVGLQYVEIDRWISDNTALMILLATVIGIIPESGPHMIFVTLFAAGVVPFPVLLASSISQDGHASIPLLAESKKSFAWAKLINCIVALVAGFAAMLFM